MGDKMAKKELQPILGIIEATYPGDPDVWNGNPMVRIRKGFKGPSSYKAALGHLPLEIDGNMIGWYHGDPFPINTYISFNILYNSSDHLSLKIFLDDETINLGYPIGWSTFHYIKLNMMGYKTSNVRIRSLKINANTLGQYSVKGGDRTWFFRNHDSAPFSSIYISGNFYLSETLERKYFHEIPRFDFIFGS